MRELNAKECGLASGGLLKALGVTGIEEGLTLAAEGGALAFAWGVGYGVGTAIYDSYDYVRYGEFD